MKEICKLETNKMQNLLTLYKVFYKIQNQTSTVETSIVRPPGWHDYDEYYYGEYDVKEMINEIKDVKL